MNAQDKRSLYTPRPKSAPFRARMVVAAWAFRPKGTQSGLHKRYLFWLYKTTKSELEKIDRKFTQLDVDRKIEKMLSAKKGISAPLKEWKDYILNKESEALKSKFSSDGSLDPGYRFLCLKLEAVEAMTKKMFGRRMLAEFKSLCEGAAMSLIAQDSSGRR